MLFFSNNNNIKWKSNGSIYGGSDIFVRHSILVYVYLNLEFYDVERNGECFKK